MQTESQTTYLHLAANAEWNDQNPLTFYNQMGGGGKSIELNVEHRDERGNLVTERPVPLKVELLYADDKEFVQTQGILSVSEACRTQVKQRNKLWFQRGAHCVTSSEGSCTIKVRVEEVSSRHDHRCFCFRVIADTSADPSACSINEVTSPPVLVCSKLPTGSGRKRASAGSATKKHIVRLPSRSPSSSSSSKRPRTDVEEDAAPSSLVPQDDGGGEPERSEMATSGRISRPRAQTAKTTSSSVPSFPAAPPLPPTMQVSFPSPAAALALSKVLKWVDSSLTVMSETRWQEAGFEPGPDGVTPDHSRPLHTLRNPNSKLNAQLTDYRNHIQGALELLVQSLEPHAVLGAHQPLQESEVRNTADLRLDTSFGFAVEGKANDVGTGDGAADDNPVLVATPVTPPSTQEELPSEGQEDSMVVVGTVLEEEDVDGNLTNEAKMPSQPSLLRNGSSGGAALDALIASGMEDEEDFDGMNETITLSAQSSTPLPQLLPLSTNSQKNSEVHFAP